MAGNITLYLVRHGEAENNVNRVGNAMPEKRKMHLTEDGIEQVHTTARFLSKQGIDAIIASPLARTRETAGIISAQTGIEVLIDDRLHETGLGIYNDGPIDKFFSKYPDMKMRISPDPLDGAESIIETRGRVESFLRDVKQVYVDKKVVVVSHGDVLDQMYGILKHQSPGQTIDDDWYPKKGSYKEVVWEI
jgi:ribonuclease H / adenosylcobalamin/alpha-ribazole phosphatase